MFRYIITILLGVSFSAYGAEPNFVETTIRYNAVSDRYEVYAKFDVSGPTNLGMSMITIVLPEECPDIMLTCQSYRGGIWIDNSRTFNENGYDYHGLITSGHNSFGFLANEEAILFDFKRPNGVKTNQVRLWDQKRDVKETKDGTDYRSNFYIAKTGYYLRPEVWYSNPTAVEDIDEETIVTLYPNPCINSIKFVMGKTINTNCNKLEIVNLEGQVVYYQALKEGVLSLDIDVHHLPAAAYLLKLSGTRNKELPFIKVNQ